MDLSANKRKIKYKKGRDQIRLSFLETQTVKRKRGEEKRERKEKEKKKNKKSKGMDPSKEF